MNNITATLVVLAAALPLAASAQTLTTSLRLGGVRTTDTNTGPRGLDDPTTFKTGYAASVALGCAMPNGLRVEGELGYLRAPVKADGGVPEGGAFKELLLMANAYYDFARMGAVRPFVGAGLGAARVSEEFTAFDNVHRINIQRDRSRTSFAYQARVGAAFDLGGHDVSVAYRYLHVRDSDYQAPNGLTILTGALKHHVLELGMTF